MSAPEDLSQPAPHTRPGIGHNSSGRTRLPVKRSEKPVSEQELLRACETLSVIIEAYGEAYWPILERLERELDIMRSRRLRIAKFNPSNKSIKRRS